jgi:hypothetical protein
MARQTISLPRPIVKVYGGVSHLVKGWEKWGREGEFELMDCAGDEKLKSESTENESLESLESRLQ